MAAVVPFVNTILASITAVSTMGRENQRLQGKIEGTLGRLQSEVRMAEWDMEKYEGTDEKLSMEMQELLCDIDDFTSDLSIPGKADAFVNSLTAKDSRPEEIELIESFLASIKSIADRQKEICKPGNPDSNVPSAAAAPSYAPEKDLDEGFPVTKRNFMELLSPAHGGQMRLISIVGFSGLGKTALARAVYEATVVQPSPPQTDIHEANSVQPSASAAEIHIVVNPVQPFPSGTEIQRAATHVPPCPPTSEPIIALETTPTPLAPSTEKINEATPVTANGSTSLQPSPPTTKNHEPVDTYEDTRVHPPQQATTENHEPITANGATPVQSPSPSMRAYDSTCVQIHEANKTTHLPPSSLPETEIQKVVAANNATPVQLSPPTAQISQPVAFNCKGWVEASTCKDAKDLLNKILNALHPSGGAGTSAPPLLHPAADGASVAIRNFLQDKRAIKS